ncbi:hypothetical protein HY375_02525 [Candidatus Berkelbacteria bacterium]|nr:hypothetical protein [Candidatus Berkelbacteria bacterium]
MRSHAVIANLMGLVAGLSWLAAVGSPVQAASLQAEFGIIGAISSLSEGSRATGVNLTTGAGFGWAREEVTYATGINYAPYDDAFARLRAAGVKLLVLLTYPGEGTSHEDWKTYVTAVVDRYGSQVDAWEIMNEADNYLSASDYVTYLSEAHEILKTKDASATIVSSGITSRIEATTYLDGIAAAGGWGKFDVVGLHVYHSGNPEKVNFGGGNLTAEFNRIVGAISRNGGGKKIWVTETGYQSGAEGAANQANWLARSLIMARSVVSVEKLFLYRLYDGSGSYGLVTSSFQEKEAYARVKEAIAGLGGAGTGTRLFPTEKTTLDAFTTVPGGWGPERSINAAVSLSGVEGYSGTGMKIAYSFSAETAYALVEKSGLSAGTPTAFAAWVNGDGTSNVWKFRFVDANNETFQVDLGSIAAGWQYQQFTLGQDSAITSWEGNGVIDYPVSFKAVVVDRQGGAAEGSGIVDELVAISGGADLYAYQFGNTVAFWKVLGSAEATLCKQRRTFAEAPAFDGVTSCNDTPETAEEAGAAVDTPSSSPAAATTKTTTKATPAAAPVEKVAVSAERSSVRVDGEALVADGTQTYRVVTTVADANRNVLKDRIPQFAITGGQSTLTEPVLVGNEWIAEVSATESGERQVVVSADGVELGSVTLTFLPIPIGVVEVREAEPVLAPVTTVVAPASLQDKLLGGFGLVALALGLWWWAHHRRHPQV